MGKKDKIRMPTGMAGLMRYEEEAKEAIKLKPKHVIAFSFGIVVVELILRFLG